MKKLLTIFRDLHDDKSGAAFIEYTVLLGVILAASIATIALVGTWAGGVWSFLESSLTPAPTPLP